MTVPNVAVVILAAGSSSRLGRPKQLLELGGEPLLRHTVRHALACSATDVVLVLGNRANEIASAAGELGQRTIVNPGFSMGQSTSLVVGISALADGTDAAIVMLGDQPTVMADLLNDLIERFGSTNAAIVQPRYRGMPGNPVLLRRDLFPELLTLTGDRGAREIIKQRSSEIEYVDFDLPVPLDVDSEEDYHVLEAAWNDG
jgi:molybdenum cofactor cytidylyltransferase